MKKAWLLLGLAGIGWLDYQSPQSLTLSLFYGILCLQAGSQLGARAAVWRAILSVSLHCAVNGFPHPWYLAALQDLCELCLLVIVGLEAALVRSKINEARSVHARLRAHLESAREVQKALLRPPILSEIPIEFSLRFEIAVELGGDSNAPQATKSAVPAPQTAPTPATPTPRSTTETGTTPTRKGTRVVPTDSGRGPH